MYERSLNRWRHASEVLARLTPRSALLIVVAAAVALLIVIALVDRGEPFDRQAAIDQMVADSDGQITHAVAQCYVDRIANDVGSRYLNRAVLPSALIESQMTAARVDCTGVENLAASNKNAGEQAPDPAAIEAGNLPRHVGDDATLDALFARCGDGDGQACDEMFDAAPVGSDYESFALTCGHRTSEIRCALVYTSASTTSVAAGP